MTIKPARYFLGVIWFLGSLFVSSVNDVISKYLGSSISPYEVMFFRYLFGLITLLPFMLYYGRKTFLTSRPLVHVARGGLLFGGIALWYHALNVVMVTMATVVSFTIPLFVLIFAKIFLGENVNKARWIATIVGLAGVIIVINPVTTSFNAMSGLLVIGSMMFAGLDIINKKFVIKESMFAMLFYSNIVTLLLSIIPAYLEWSTPSLHDLCLFLILGGGANLILFCLLKAFALDDASALAPYRYTELFISAALGYLIFSEIPTIHTVIGAMIIIPATLFVIYNEIRK